jgi:hypothetical protein
MAGRINYQRATYQCVRPGGLWQIQRLEETGTIVSTVYDTREQRMSALIAFSECHWKHPEEAHGDKRNSEDLKRWRRLADVGNQTSRFMLCEQANILQTFKGKGGTEAHLARRPAVLRLGAGRTSGTVASRSSTQKCNTPRYLCIGIEV